MNTNKEIDRIIRKLYPNGVCIAGNYEMMKEGIKKALALQKQKLKTIVMKEIDNCSGFNCGHINSSDNRCDRVDVVELKENLNKIFSEEEK